MKKLLIVNIHHIKDLGLELLVKSKNADIDVQTATSSTIAKEQLALNADVQLLIIILDHNTIDLASQVLKTFPNMGILAVTCNIGMCNVQRLYSTGIKGVVDINNPIEIILQAVEEVLAGQTFMEEKFKNYLLRTPATFTMSRVPHHILTKREEEVIGLMLKGKKMGEISISLNLKPSTISTFKTKIYRKLGVNSILELKEVYTQQF